MDLSPWVRAAGRKPTPAPGVEVQVVSEVKDAVGATRSFASDLMDQLPVMATRLLMALAVILVGFVIVKVGRLLIRKLFRSRRSKQEKTQRTETARSIVSSLFGYVMYFIVIAVVLRIFGVDLTSILAAAGVVGVAIGFGAQTLIKDIISGMFIWGEGNLAVGDLVSINDLTGTVESISIRTTVLRNYNGDIYTIPNGDIRSMTNMSRGFRRAIVNVPCPYEENQEQIVAIVKDEMANAPLLIPGVKQIPDVMSIVSFDNHAVRLQVAVVCPVGEHWRVERAIRSMIKARFDREGIMMPHYIAPPQNDA